MEMSGYQYNCSGCETFDSIAREVYGDEVYAAEIMCANPEYCGLSVFTGGEEVLLPSIEIEEDEEDSGGPSRAPWKE